MTTTELVSVGRAALTDLLEQWWATVEVTPDDGRSCRVRLSIEWSPWDKKFTVDPEAVELVDVSGDGAVPDRADIVAAFHGSEAEKRAHDVIRTEAGRHREKFPDRVKAIAETR